MAVSGLCALVCLVGVFSLAAANTGDRPNLEAKIEFEWTKLDYRYYSPGRKNLYLQDPSFFIPANAIIGDIAVYKYYVYVAIPRVKTTGGVPWVLGWVYPYGSVSSDPRRALIQPFPNWDVHAVGDCDQLQNPTSMEVDPNTGMLWVADTGTVGTRDPHPIKTCPAKLVVYDLTKKTEVYRHVFPQEAIDADRSLLQDIVIDYTYPHSDQVRFVYIADSGRDRIIVHDFVNNDTWTFSDPSMSAHRGNVTINGRIYPAEAGISGLALSPDFNFIYWSSMYSDVLYQMPTWPLRTNPLGDVIHTSGLVRAVGHKAGGSDGLAGGRDSLYYGALGKDAVYRWERRADMQHEHTPEGELAIKTQTQLAQSWSTMQWPDSLCLDEYQALWFSSDKQHLFLSDQLDFNQTIDSNFRIFRLHNTGDYSYLLDRAPDQPVVG